jgi:uncharacterized protein
MLGVTLQSDESNLYLDLVISPQLVQKQLDSKAIQELITKSEFHHYFIFEQNIYDAISTYKTALKSSSSTSFTQRIGERRDTTIKCKIREDQLSASLTLTCGYAGKPLTLQDLQAVLTQNGIVRGISTKRLAKLVSDANAGNPGDVIEIEVAKGLPPRNGRPSKLQPLVQNALERILRPQNLGNTRVDMRNLGDVICVKKGTDLLRRLPPTEGRSGISVTGTKIKPKAGEWEKLRPGEGTVISDKDENLILADMSGMPKFKDMKMWVDDTFICKGVNVGTGNVNYDGAVLVNGDVTEKMQIIAKGDVTINGFVESAYIEAGGDIIITEGAMGKVNDSATEYSTKLFAKGSIHIQHGQGLDIVCNGNVTIGRQLAYSQINCKGEVSVGPVDKPNGNIFGCIIKCHNKVSAGTFGAVSGSNLSIDFSDGFNSLLERKDTLDELLRQIRQNNTRHRERMDIIKTKFIPKDMQRRVKEANELLNNESQLLDWLETKAKEIKASKDKYQTDIQLIANKRVYPGVVVKLNNRTWRAEREYDRARILFEGHQWQYAPLL